MQSSGQPKPGTSQTSGQPAKPGALTSLQPSVLATTTTSLTGGQISTQFAEGHTQTVIYREEQGALERKERPAVVHEKVIPFEREEIQPIIHRDREKTEIVQVEAPSYQTEVRPIMIHEAQLPAERKADVRASTKESDLKYQEFGQMYHSTTERAATQHKVIQRTPIIEEHVRKTVIEEVQPVIHKEVIEPHIIRENLPIYEKVVEAPTVTRVIREMEGLHLEDHNLHHSHHSMALGGKLQCNDCRKFHEFPEVCQMCAPLHRYEGCIECSKSNTSFLPLFPGLVLLEDHNKHHHHHADFLNARISCFDCQRLHNKESCSLCAPAYYYEGCNECSQWRNRGVALPAFPGLATQHQVYLQQREPTVRSISQSQPLPLKTPLEPAQGYVTTTRSEFSQAKQQM